MSEDLMAILNARGTPKKRLPRPVIQKAMDKREWSRVLGYCTKCNWDLIRNKDGILRAPLIVALDGKFDAQCIDNQGHIIDMTRLTTAGRKVYL